MTWEFILRLALAGLLGGIIGIDREYRAKEAGLRTHFLVSLGSALIMIVSQWGFHDILKYEHVGLDPSRVAAQVVSGIGFIGAGTIILQKQFVRGLTTAAGLWATAGIGLAIAQTPKTITGVVISEEDNQPVVGASVLVKGTAIGTTTNVDGKFTISNVPSSARTKSIGYPLS